MASFRIEHRLGIAAPADRIWEVLADLPEWPQWNPWHVRAEGVLRIGEPLRLTQADGSEIGYRVVDWVPDTQILLRAAQTFGLLTRTRFMEIEKLSEVGCVFSNGEIWSGPLAKYVGVPAKRAAWRGFEAMSEALSARVTGK